MPPPLCHTCYFLEETSLLKEGHLPPAMEDTPGWTTAWPFTDIAAGVCGGHVTAHPLVPPWCGDSTWEIRS